ncbi:MAG: PH domain-containing protein [Pseudonocardia sp.]
MNSPNPAPEPTPSRPDADPAPQTAVFRNSPLNVLAVLALAVCAVPVAFGAPWLWLVLLVPLALGYWVLRIRTTAGPDELVARGVLRARSVPWADITALRLRSSPLRSSRTRSRISAVLNDGTELTLPAVHVRDLPLLAAASRGRIPDFTAEPAGAVPSDQRPTTDPGPTTEHAPSEE